MPLELGRAHIQGMLTISPDFTRWVIQALVALFLAILFLQSGIDKIVDRPGNLEWLNSHFSKSPLAKTVGPMFLVITIMENAAGILNGLGVLLIVFRHDTSIALAGAIVAATSLTALFFGQRVAKDYAGAAVLVPYFLLTVVAMWVQGIWGT